MALQALFKQIAMDQEITLEAHRVLNILFANSISESCVKISQRDICKELGMKPPNVSRAIKILINKGIITKNPHFSGGSMYCLKTDMNTEA